MNTKAKILHPTSLPTAIDRTKQELKFTNTGVQDYLKTRYEGVNKQLYGGFRFGNLVLLAGLSGHGKSYFLTILRNDFLNRELNDFDDIVYVHFNFEMDETDELMREASTATGVSYEEMVSPYVKLTTGNTDKLNNYLDSMKDKPLYFVSTPGNRVEICNTIEAFAEKFKGKRLIISMDHILLTEVLVGENDIQTVGTLASDFIRLKKKYKILFIIVDQLNSEIEKPERASPRKIVPKLSDIFGSKKINHACDIVFVVVQPSKLGVNKYGLDSKNLIDTRNLVVLQGIKRRKGGELPAFYFENNLDKGRLNYLKHS